MQQHPPVSAKWYRFVILAACVLLTTGLATCKHTAPDGNSPATASGPAAAVQTTTHQGVGVVKATDVKRPSIEIDHQEIKGLMPAMTMEFYVTDKSLLDGLKPGDHIEFTLENGVGGIKITSIRKS